MKKEQYKNDRMEKQIGAMNNGPQAAAAAAEADNNSHCAGPSYQKHINLFNKIEVNYIQFFSLFLFSPFFMLLFFFILHLLLSPYKYMVELCIILDTLVFFFFFFSSSRNIMSCTCGRCRRNQTIIGP